jgi:hypothetical protein
MAHVHTRNATQKPMFFSSKVDATMAWPPIFTHLFVSDPTVVQQNCEFLPIVDVESIFDGRLTVNNDSLSCLGDPDSSLGRMALLR